MKRKELYQFIREGIIEELTETDLDKTAGSVIMKKDTNPSDIKKVTSQGIDVELKEMARIPNKIRLGDDAKITLAKELYGPETIEGRLIAAIEGSEDGLTQKN